MDKTFKVYRDQAVYLANAARVADCYLARDQKRRDELIEYLRKLRESKNDNRN